MYPHYRQIVTFDGFRLPFLAQTETNPATQNLCFNIRFHVYIHDYFLDNPIGTLPSRLNTYVPPNIGLQLHLMVFGYLFRLKQKLIPQLTQNLCFNIRFHLYIHDYILDEPIGTLTSMVNTCVPQI